LPIDRIVQLITPVETPSTLLQALVQLPVDDDDKAPKKYISTYTYEDLCNACVRAGNKDLRGTDAAALYQIPLRSFRRAFAAYKKTGVVPNTFEKQGAPPMLSPDDELMLGRWANVRAERQQSVTHAVFLHTAGLIWALRYKQRYGTAPAHVWKPSHGWFDGYCERMKKRGEPMNRTRVKIRNAKAPTREVTDQWFASLASTLVSLGLMVDGRVSEDKRSRIINIDETGVERLDAKHLRVVVPAHKEGALALFKQPNDHVTLVGAVDASGERLPPFFIIKGKRSPLDLQNVMQRTACTPPNSGWACSVNGWITSHIWFNVLEWVVALKSPTKDNPVLVLADCHSTRFNPAVLQWAMEHHCHVFTLPRNATSFLQPLDVGVFSPVKTALRASMTDLAVKHVALDKTTIPLLLYRAWEAGATKENILAGWRACNMGVFDMTMSTAGMSSQLFTPSSGVVVAASPAAGTGGCNDDRKTQTNETWMPPHELASILRVSAEERKADPPRGTSFWLSSRSASSVNDDRLYM
jgi:hypothetical protein